MKIKTKEEYELKNYLRLTVGQDRPRKGKSRKRIQGKRRNMK